MTRQPLAESIEPSAPRRCAWLSAHFYVLDADLPEVADRVILELVAPLVEEAMAERLLRRFFFIRYNDDGGAHVRLRLLGLREPLDQRLRALFEQRTETPVERVLWVPYEPEVARFGGPASMRLAECLFSASSQAAIALLRRSAREPREALIGRALFAMMVILHTLCGSRRLAVEVARLCHDGMAGAPPRELLPSDRFEQSFSRQSETLGAYLEKAWHQLDHGLPLTPELDRYRGDLAPLAGRLRRLAERGALFPGAPVPVDLDGCLARLLPSYLHLMNNRLGIALQEEIYLAGLIWRSEERAAAVSRG